MLYAQSAQPHAQRCRIAAGNHRWRNASFLQQFQAVAIERVEALEGFATLAEINAAISQYAIHVKKNHAHV